MMRAAVILYRRFIASTRGVAAIEFAAILPVLVIMFLASFDGGRAIATYMKVRSATYTLDAITNQYPTIATSDLQTITAATAQVMAPYSASPLVATVSQIAISSTGKVTVSWSYSMGGSARAQGSSITIPSAIKVNSSYLIFSEVSYTYTPMFGFFGSGGINFSDNLYITPRSSSCVLYPSAGVTAC
jgi:Flp pilus assembly protein TadG